MRTLRRLLAAAVLLAAVAAPPPARAQSAQDAAAFLALIFTPQGALPATAWGVDARTARPAFDLVYGRQDLSGQDAPFNNFGLTFSMPQRLGRFGLSLAGITCSGCNAYLMGRVEAELPLLAPAAPEMTTGPMFGLALQPAIGYGLPTDNDADGYSFSATVGAPLSVTTGTGWRFTTFVTPTVGFGHFDDGARSESGTRFLLGGGMRLTSTANGLGVFAGIQHVFIQDSDPVIGAGVSFAMRRR